MIELARLPLLTFCSYEGDWDNDWEPAKSAVRSSVTAVPATIPPDPLNNYVVPRGTSLLEAKKTAQRKSKHERKSAAAPLPSGYRPNLQNFDPRARSGTNQHHALPPKPIGDHVQQRVLQLAGHTRYTENKSQSDGRYSMMHTFKEMAESLQKHSHLPPLQVAADELAKICISTNTFIKVPIPEDHSLEIWGTLEHVEQARKSLKAWEMYWKPPGKDKHTKVWQKQNAVDGRDEHREMRQTLAKHQQDVFQQFADTSILPFKAHLIWPDKGDLLMFITDYDESVLHDIRRKYDCIVAHDLDTSETRIACGSQQAIIQVYARLIGLMKEMIARKRTGLRTVQCRFPAPDEFCNRVGVKPFMVKGTRVFLPQPLNVTGSLPPGEEHWSALSTDNNQKYRNAIKKALRSTIRSLYVSDKHVRMRVSFGALALTDFERPTIGQDTYDIGDFIKMVQNPRVTVTQCPLATGADFGLLNQLDKAEELGKPEYSWAVQCDFAGAQGSTLRLEKEFTQNYLNDDEVDSSARRWLTYSSDTTKDVNELLEISHMVLGKVGYQFHVGAARLYENHKTKQELRSFEGTVNFTPAGPDARFPPGRHATFPPGNKDLQVVKEITIARYPFKKTKGTFEMRRVDIFSQRPGETSSLPHSTEWYAYYYYLEWDALMSKLGGIEAGGDIEWRRELETFFPKVEDKDYPKLLPDGYKQFMKEVEEIQELLTKATEKVRGPEEAKTNGVKQ